MTDHPSDRTRGVPSGARLHLVGRLTAELDARQLRYCHWKSNEHLLAAVSGNTDLDVLFDNAARRYVHQALRAAGFRQAHAVWHRRYPLIEDHVAIDPTSGRLVHVHAHFGLIVGEEATKSFHLPWEDEVLDTCHIDAEAGFPAASPTYELLLLLIRSAIKRNYPSLRKRLLGGRLRPAETTDEDREFVWLKQRVSEEQLAALAEHLLGYGSIAAIRALYADGRLTSHDLKMLFTAAELRRFLRRNAVAALANRWWRWAAGLCSIAAVRSGLLARMRRRRLEGPGLIVATLGSDGSGKSTLVKALDSVLSKKLDVERLYLGSGDGPCSLLRWPLVRLRKRRQQRKAAVSPPSGGANPSRRPNSLLRAFAIDAERMWWAVSLALERRGKLNRASRARASGIIVITDRYPQSTIEGHNDGPLLGDLASHKVSLLRALAHWERACYLPQALPQPDLVLKLAGAPELLHRRRPDMTPEVIATKQAGILSIRFPTTTRVLQIDAAQPAETVLTTAMSAIGDAMSAFVRSVQ